MTNKRKSGPHQGNKKPAKAQQHQQGNSGKQAKQHSAGKQSGVTKAVAISAAGAGLAALAYAFRNRIAGVAEEAGDALRAHQADGRDSSREFAAQIADENLIPETTPIPAM